MEFILCKLARVIIIFIVQQSNILIETSKLCLLAAGNNSCGVNVFLINCQSQKQNQMTLEFVINEINASYNQSTM